MGLVAIIVNIKELYNKLIIILMINFYNKMYLHVTYVYVFPLYINTYSIHIYYLRCHQPKLTNNTLALLIAIAP